MARQSDAKMMPARVYKNMIRGAITLVFRCEIAGGQLATSDETSAYCWAQTGLDQRPGRRGAYAIRVLDAMHEHRPAAFREPDGRRLV
jgi:8-oxo-dGTP diphosphatase